MYYEAVDASNTAKIDYLQHGRSTLTILTGGQGEEDGGPLPVIPEGIAAPVLLGPRRLYGGNAAREQQNRLVKSRCVGKRHRE